MKRFSLILLTLLLLLAGVVYFNYPKLKIISGYAAKNMASTLAFTGRSIESIENTDHDVPMVRLAEAERTDSAITASVFSMAERAAVCRDGLGCVLVPPGAGTPPALPKPARSYTPLPGPYPWGHGSPSDTLLPEVDYEQVERALDLAFSAPEQQRTRTALILYKGQLLGERYAAGYGPDTPVLGWSMTKSLLATLYGILVSEGKLDLDQQVPVASWQDDERAAITYKDLLQMNSGLAWDEDYSSISDVTRMLFQASDMSVVQAQNELLAPPGTLWNYSSGTTNLLAGELRGFFPDLREYLEFPYQTLGQKLGMHSLLIETDWVGNFVGSSYGWASTRDWGRFGQLYLQQGTWNDTQLFEPEWISFVTQEAPGSSGAYGGHFYLNKNGAYPSAPADLYLANGYQGQHVFIIPSRSLVVVRTGLAESPDFNGDAFLKALLKALPE